MPLTAFIVVGRALRALRKRVARPLVNLVRTPRVLLRTARASVVRFGAFELATDPQVFHPLCFSSSWIFTERLRRRDLRGLRVLDMGTGAGPVAVVAAARGAAVTACDINPRAVELARANLSRNGLRGEVHESDLFSALEGRVFDLICFNVPFYARDASTHYERAFFAGRGLETVRRFAAGCAAHLEETRGRVCIIFSEETDQPALFGAFEAAGFVVDDRQVNRHNLEDFHTVSLRRR